MLAIAIIPTIRKSEYLDDLVKTLLGDGVTVIVVDGAEPPSLVDAATLHPERAQPGLTWLYRKDWNIYRTWNLGLKTAREEGDDTLFILNDDLVIKPGAFAEMDKCLASSGFALLSFEDPLRENHQAMRANITKERAISDTTLPASNGWAHGICGYAFAVHTDRIPEDFLFDEGYIWYCGDDDFFYRVAKADKKIGVAHGILVSHPDPMHSSKDKDNFLPNGWHEHDLARMRGRWGENVSNLPDNASLPEMFIGIPSHDGKISAPLHVWLSSLTALSACGQFPYRVNVAILQGISPVQYARNRLLAQALTTEAERIVMIDDDMLPDPSCMPVLFSPADICVPRMYRFRHNGPDALSPEENTPPEIATCATFVEVKDGKEERYDVLPDFSKGGVIKVQGAGTGFIMIKRKVLDDPRMRVGPSDEDGTPALFRMFYTATGHITEYEDIDFTWRATQLGYTVVADMGAHCGHRKAINLDAVAELVHRAKKG